MNTKPLSIPFKNLLAGFIIFLTVISVNDISWYPIGNMYSNWITYSVILLLCLKGKKKYYDQNNKKTMLFVKLYLIWICICILRGIFVAEYYWDYKSLVGSGLSILLASSVFIFMNPLIIQNIISKWLKYALMLFCVVIFFIDPMGFGYFLAPISFLALFFPTLNIKWKIVILLVTSLVVFADLDARSNVIKFVLPLVFSCLFFFSKLLDSKFYKLLFKILFILPVILLALGASDVFNVFRMDEYISGTYTEKKIIDGEIRELNLKADTRTFLYQEVIVSAIKNEYILFGRTPARGNDSYSFGIHAAEDLKTGRYERYSNEASILNIFTWTGLVGVILYFLVFYKAASLAITRSNSRFLKIIGIYVAFRWMYAWVEDFNRFNIMNVMLWIIIAMCYSEQFRKMTDLDFKNWLRSILRHMPYKINYKTNRALHRHPRI